MTVATVRAATQADLPAILELTRRNRALLAELEPHFWRKSANADELHRLFVGYQIANEGLSKRVLERDGEVIGYSVAASHPSGFFVVDDVCLAAHADWKIEGVQLLRSISERPALMTAPHGQEPRVLAAQMAGLRRIGTVRTVRFDQSPPVALESEVPAITSLPVDAVPSPLHVWMPAMTHESVTVLGDGRGGYVMLSGPLWVPPIYDPGGKPSVVDRVIGDDRRYLVRVALTYAQRRGDVGVIFVIDEHDQELATIADEMRARHPVDTFWWPD